MSSTSNTSGIETRERSFHLPDYPGAEYTVTLARSRGRGAQGWMLAEVIVRSTGGPLVVEGFPPTERLVRAALSEDPPAVFQTAYDSTRELELVPERYRRALHRRGIRTVDGLLGLTHDQLRQVHGIGDTGVAAIEHARTRYRAERLAQPDD
ncbi:hypothetical protein ACIRRA_44340 [Nocardia sp. NPDC101769]|uniref:hypothetical protein n=1 Tax=Nocardia sp. NPDC101769 TaxID=3364333 RepID=UPI003815020A